MTSDELFEMVRQQRKKRVTDALKKAYPYGGADANTPMYDGDFERMADAAIKAYHLVEE